MLPENDVQLVQDWLDQRNDGFPLDLRDKIRYEIDTGAHDITLFECRPPWKAEFGPDWTRSPVARLHYTIVGNVWSLFWRNKYGEFHVYDIDPSPDVSDLLAQIDSDPTAIFWG